MFIVAYEQTVLRCLRDCYRATNTDPLAANLSLGSITGRPRGLFPDTLASGHRRGVATKVAHAPSRTAATTHAETPVFHKFSSFSFFPCPSSSLHGFVCFF